MLTKFLSFATVGVFGTAAHYTVLWALVEAGDVPVVAATTAGFVVGAIVNYVLNRRFTFVSKAAHSTALPKFLTVAAFGTAINALVVALLVEQTNIYYLVAQLFATGAVLVWNFAANYAWTFRT